jgi:hypothetical protein
MATNPVPDHMADFPLPTEKWPALDAAEFFEGRRVTCRAIDADNNLKLRTGRVVACEPGQFFAGENDVTVVTEWDDHSGRCWGSSLAFRVRDGDLELPPYGVAARHRAGTCWWSVSGPRG